MKQAHYLHCALLGATVLLAPVVPAIPPDVVIQADGVSQSTLGMSGCNLGDVDGDGIDDLALGASSDDIYPESLVGRAYVFSGADGSLIHEFTSPNPVASGQFGLVATAGDLNGDTKSDLIIGAVGEQGNGITKGGRVYVYSGSDWSLLYTIEAPTPQDTWYFGTAVGLPDVTGDSVPDIMVGSHGTESTPPRLYVFSGTDGSWVRTIDSPNAENYTRLDPLDWIGDLNSDTYPEIIVFANEHVQEVPDTGRVYVFSPADGALLYTFECPSADNVDDFGLRSIAVPDMNSDTVPDILIGSDDEEPTGTGGRGILRFYSGADGSLIDSLENPDPDNIRYFGQTYADIGDFDGDGSEDLVVSVHHDGSPELKEVYLYSTPDLTHFLTIDAPFNIDGYVSPMGIRIDTNEDNKADLVARYSPYTGGTVWIYREKIPRAAVSPAAIDYGSRDPGEGPAAPVDVTILNDGLKALTFTGNEVEITGADAGEFALTLNDPVAPLEPLQQIGATVTFDPNVSGAKSASLQVTTDDPNAPLISVPLTGTGAHPPDEIGGVIYLTTDSGVLQIDPDTGDRFYLVGAEPGSPSENIGYTDVVIENESSLLIAFPDWMARADRTSGEVNYIYGEPLVILRAPISVYIRPNSLVLESPTSALFSGTEAGYWITGMYRLDLTDNTLEEVYTYQTGFIPEVSEYTGMILVEGDAYYAKGVGEEYLVRLDLATGTETVLSSQEIGFGSSGLVLITKLVYSTQDGNFYAGAEDYSSSPIEENLIVQINPSTGNRIVVATMPLGPEPNTSTLTALALADNGDLLALTEGNNDVLYRVDPATGAYTVISRSGIDPVGSGPALNDSTSLYVGLVQDITTLAPTKAAGWLFYE
ncbi:FG-GAP repeat protein [bacterium]|nr:FG-GAP repeat protein [bacterium]